MITRIVRMEFNPADVPAFLAMFQEKKGLIRHFPGVLKLELHRDAQAENVFYTYSHWTDEKALEAYRYSDLFRSIWPQTKSYFAGPPVAYSLKKEMVVE